MKQANPESSWFIWWFMCARRHLACPKEAIRKWCGLGQCPGHWTHIAKSLSRKGSHLHCLSKRKTLHHQVPSLTPVPFSHPWSSNGTHITHCWAWSSEHVKMATLSSCWRCWLPPTNNVNHPVHTVYMAHPATTSYVAVPTADLQKQSGRSNV